MGALLKAPVSTGFVSRCLVRLDAALTAAGFEGALKDALRAADVLGTDETPAPLTTAGASAEGCGNPHVYTVRTMRAYTGGGADLISYGAAGDRTKLSISRRWHKGNHPGLILARRLKRKASQVWLFATRFDVPATNNGSENAVRGYKLAAKISGCWRTLPIWQR